MGTLLPVLVEIASVVGYTAGELPPEEGGTLEEGVAAGGAAGGLVEPGGLAGGVEGGIVELGGLVVGVLEGLVDGGLELGGVLGGVEGGSLSSSSASPSYGKILGI